MEKVTEFLEKYVQWIALGIAGVFLLWAVYAFVLTSPAVVTVRNETFGPGDVDRHYAGTPAQTLKRDAEEKKLLALPQIPDTATQKRAPLPAVQAMAFTPTIYGATVGGQRTNPGAEIAKGDVNLPKLIAATYIDHVGAIVSINLPPNPANPAAAPRADKSVAAVNFEVAWPPLRDAWVKANFPPGVIQDTWFLSVEWERAEVIGGGAPAAESFKPVQQVIIAGNPLPTAPDFAPTNDQQRQNEQVGFAQAISERQQDLTNPPYHPTTIYEETGPAALPKAVVPKDVVKPVVPPVRPPPPVRPVGPGRGPGRGVEEGRPVAIDPGRPAMLAQAGGQPGFGRRPNPNEEGPASGEEFGNPGAPGAPGGALTAAGPGVVQRGPQFIPGHGINAPKFNPITLGGSIELGLRDDTVQAGKTYVYRVRYRLYNPVFGNRPGAGRQAGVVQRIRIGVTLEPAVLQVVIPRDLHFFLAGAANAGNLGNFNLNAGMVFFRWREGRIVRIQQSFTPGDAIRIVDGDSVIDTGLTMVDVRSVNNTDTVVTFVDADGKLVHRRKGADDNDPARREMESKSKAGVAAGQPGAGQPGAVTP